MTYLKKIFKVLMFSFMTMMTATYSYAADSATSAEKQANMTPKQALLKLKAGNQRFLSGKMQTQDYLAQAKQGASGQFPWAVILNCMDSRSVPEFFFNQGLTDFFSLRVAGNVLNEDILGSIEYATKAAGAPLIVVLGHTSCGAVSAACQHDKFGHIGYFTHKIKPVIPGSQKESGTDNCSDPKLINKIAKNNALNVARQIREKSPIINQLIATHKIGIVAGIHNVETGAVTFFEEGRLMPFSGDVAE